MSKRILSFVLAALMVFATIPAVALSTTAAELEGLVFYRGTDGTVTTKPTDGNIGSYEDIDWNISDGWSWSLVDGVMTIKGTGAMSKDGDAYPWDSLKDEIKKVVVLPGVDSISSQAFNYCDNLTEVVIGEGLTTLKGDAFAHCKSLQTITLPSTLTTVNQGVVYGTNNVKNVYLSGMTFDEYKAAVSFGAYNDCLTGANANVTYTTLEYTPLTLGVWGWENWVNSPNKGDYESVTQLLVTLANEEGLDPMVSSDYTWKLTIASGDDSRTITMSPATHVADYKLYRFEVCLGEGENQFIPMKGVTYTVAIEVYDGETLKYKTQPVDGFKCGMDPVVPSVESRPLITNKKCYIETDLGSALPLESVTLVNYQSTSRYYRWSVYATNDKTLPIEQWTLLGGKNNDEVPKADGHVLNMTLNAEDAYDEYQYVRIYGTYNSANGGYHFCEVKLTTAAEGYVITFNVDGEITTQLVPEGEVPVYDGVPSKAVTMDKQYTFTGWDKELVAATEAATYVAQFEESVRPARVVTLEGWGAMENWNWGSVEKQSQLLVQVNTDDPAFQKGDVLTANNYNNFRWVITFDWTDGEGNPHTEKHTMTPWSTITENNNFRFRLVSGPDAFVPEKGVAYTVNVDLYDMTLTDKYGPAGYHAYTSEVGRTHILTQNDGEGNYEADAMYNDEYVTADDFCTITWKLEDETVYTSKVLKGLVPTYPGTPLAETVIENGIYKTLVTPATVAATEDATYTFTYSTDMTLGIYNNTTWENWPENNTDTQLLLMVYDKLGNTTPELYDNKNLYDWAVVIDGVEYKCAPDSSYITEDYFSIYRFEIAKNATFVPEAGANYKIGLKIYDKEGNLVAESTNTIDSTVPEGFEPIVNLKAGDIDRDGNVSISDVTELLSVIAGKTELNKWVDGDLDNDDAVSISDVTVLLSAIAGKVEL